MVHFRNLFYFSIFCFFMNQVILADIPVKTPLEWLNELEIEITGKTSEGSLVERLKNLEESMTGRNYEGSLWERLSRLDTILFVNQPHDISLLYKIQASEWILYQEESSAPFKNRLEKLEQTVFGSVYAGSFTKRVEKLIDLVFPDGVIKGKWVTVPEGLLIKIKLLDELNSSKNKPLDRFRFTVVETVFCNNSVVFPKGVTATGVLREVTRPANFGRDARLVLDFAEIRALDATLVSVCYGSKSLEKNKSRQLTVGAGAAGMLAFGPGGILLAFAIKGQEMVIPANTEFYLQVKDPVRIYTLEESRG